MNQIDASPLQTANFLKAHNAKHLWHPMIAPAQSAEAPPLIVERAEGSRIWDIDGNAYIDAVGGLWNVNVGHGRTEVKRAIIEQLDRLAYYSTFTTTTNPPAIELSARLVKMLAREGMSKVLFSSGGSDAIEGAIKVARQFWKLAGQPERTKIISLRYGYHGVHFGGLSANGNPAFRRAYEPLMPGFFQVEAPFLYRNRWTDDPSRLAEICADLLEAEILHQGADTVAAFLAEPIQGAGGVIVPPPTYWPLVRAVCERTGVLLIADEIVTGFGRSGAMFGARLWDVKPDIMCFAKGINAAYIPLGATVINDRVAAAWSAAGPLARIMHGYTYSGHPVACAAALATLDIVEQDDLPAQAARQGAYLMTRLNALAQSHALIGDVRGQGLMAALELVSDRATKTPIAPSSPALVALARACLDEGVMIRVNENKIILSPPLTISQSEIDKICDAIDAGLAVARRALA